MANRAFCIHVGTGRAEKLFNVKHLPLSKSSIENYVITQIAPKSVFQDLLVPSYVDGQGQKIYWQLQWLLNGKGDESVMKNGQHSTRHASIAASDSALHDVAKRVQQAPIHLQIVFNNARFEKWDQKQIIKENIPIPTIISSEENDKYLRVIVNYPQKVIYQLYYKIYEKNQTQENYGAGGGGNGGVKVEWKALESGSNEILVSDLWKFKKYTMEVVLKNQYTGIYGVSAIKNEFEILSDKMIFEGAAGAAAGATALCAKTTFEKLEHIKVYEWCKQQLEFNDVFNDIRNMEHGKFTLEYVLTMIKGFEKLVGNAFLWKDASSNLITSNLLRAGKKFLDKNKNGHNKDAFTIDLIRSILCRLRVIAFKEQVKSQDENTKNVNVCNFEEELSLGYVPNNEYLIYFWCFLNEKPLNTDIYIRCCEPSPS